MIKLYTDGSCLGNPGPGGWAYVLEYKGYRVFGADCKTNTTNNEMELLAVISGLEKITERHIDVEIVSDSQYVVNGITQWLDDWRNRGWKNSRRETIRNLDLWLRMDSLLKTFKNVKATWIKSHNGHEWNEYCDELARLGADKAKEKMQ